MTPQPYIDDTICPEIKNLSTCAVCSSPTDGTHFGVCSCRACAAFFRRSVSMNKKYVCRAGGDKCNLHSKKGFCRKCRFRRCIEVGMKVEYVQAKPPGVTVKEKPLSFPEFNEVQLPSTSSVPENQQTLIQRICINYKKLCMQRKQTEREFFAPSIPAEMSNYPGLFLCTAAELTKIYNSHLPHILEFLHETFPDFKRMGNEYQFPIFQSFMAMVWRLDNARRTMEYVAPANFSKINVLTETTYVDMDQVDLFISQTTSKKFMKSTLLGSLRDVMGAPRLRMMQAMVDMNLSEEEFGALLGLAVWNQENSSYPDEEAQKMLKRQIFAELQLHYERQNIKNCAIRLGELMCLYNAMVRAAARMRENVVLLELLDTFGEESIIYSFYKNCTIFG